MFTFMSMSRILFLSPSPSILQHPRYVLPHPYCRLHCNLHQYRSQCQYVPTPIHTPIHQSSEAALLYQAVHGVWRISRKHMGV
ncbi:hypothetical protein EDD17DRAFT_1611912 [Pisolithus thermaeus]|nr:hypothetical protein EDD17DRAFT_1611912 [Pisolithus thermaeus]